ncbi:MAG: phosphoribosylglycinamide formyltransferase [Candidatus Omnitrophica bacterium]|nr:phosphoribosylglycinamide formyltransferase [Candidatus Omnitrophota bacterium]
MFTIGVLASGKGTNLQAIIDYIKQENLPIRIGVVISDNPNAYALERAKKEGIKAVCIPCEKYKTILGREIEKKYVEVLKENKVELVCLAGFMRVLKSTFLRSFPNKIINIHPSLLPAFPGLEAWKQALEYGVKFTGCTVHFVNEGIDTGPIILQAVVPVLPDDTPETLHKRIQEKEHIIYPLAIRLIYEGRVSISGRKVIIK